MRGLIIGVVLALGLSVSAGVVNVVRYRLGGSLTETLDVAGQKVVDSTQVLELGGDCAGAGMDTGDVCFPEDVFVPTFTNIYDVPLGDFILNTAAANNPTPGNAGVGATLLFATDADDIVFYSWRVPQDIKADTDVVLKWQWAGTSTDPLALNETVTWQIQSRSHQPGQEFNGGSANDQSVTYTETDNPDTDREIHQSTLTLDEDDPDQPFVAGDMLQLSFRRDVDTDNYSGGANLLMFWIEYQSNRIAVE